MKPALSVASMFAAAVTLAASLPAQTARPTVHRSTTARPHSAASAAKPCPLATPELSPKIPALAPAAGCPKALYTLSYIDTEIGTGELAQQRKWYTVHYTGYLPDGTKFDSSFDHPGSEPITFPYGAHQVIPGWDTGFEGMHVGGKRRLFIPYQLAYGENGRPPVIPAKAQLIFDVQLVGMSDTPPQAKPLPAPTGKPADTKPTEAKPDQQPSGTSKPADALPQNEGKPATPPPTQSTTPGASSQPK